MLTCGMGLLSSYMCRFWDFINLPFSSTTDKAKRGVLDGYLYALEEGQMVGIILMMMPK